MLRSPLIIFSLIIFFSCSADRTRVAVKEMSDEEFGKIVEFVKEEKEKQKEIALADKKEDEKVSKDSQEEKKEEVESSEIIEKSEDNESKKENTDKSDVDKKEVESKVKVEKNPQKKDIEEEIEKEDDDNVFSEDLEEESENQSEEKENIASNDTEDKEHNSSNDPKELKNIKKTIAIKTDKKPLSNNDLNKTEIKELDIDNNQSIDESLEELNKKLLKDPQQLIPIFNPLGYSITVPYSYDKILENSQLWKIKGKTKASEQQLIIGYIEKKAIPLTSLLTKIVSSYSEKLNVDWSRIQVIDEAHLKDSHSNEAYFSEVEYETKGYRNYLQIRCYRKEQSMAFVIGSLTLPVKAESKETSKDFITLMNSFRFVQQEEVGK